MLLSNYCCSRYWAEGNDIWMQQVSSAPSTRADVLQLKESLDEKLKQRGARRMGICPIRTKLYSQCFGRRGCETIIVSVVRTINRGQCREKYCFCITLCFSFLLSLFRRADQTDGCQLCWEGSASLPYQGGNSNDCFYLQDSLWKQHRFWHEEGTAAREGQGWHEEKS